MLSFFRPSYELVKERRILSRYEGVKVTGLAASSSRIKGCWSQFCGFDHQRNRPNVRICKI